MAVSSIRPLLLAFLVLTIASTLAPAPKRIIPSSWCMAPLLLGAVVFAAAALAALFGGVLVAFDLSVLGATVLMPAFWLARAPFSDDEANGDDGGGGGGGGGGTQPRTSPPAGGIDWQAFDRARARWGRPRQPAHERVLVGTPVAPASGREHR
jgi:hypothetical protein